MLNLVTEGHTQTGPYPALAQEIPKMNNLESLKIVIQKIKQTTSLSLTGKPDLMTIATQQYHKLAE